MLAILQARTSSTRLPGKVLEPVLGEPMLARQVERVRRCRQLDDLVVATSTEPSDDPLAALCERLEVGCYRGDLADVLGRFCGAAGQFRADHVVRLTADCPLADPGLIDTVIGFYLDGEYDYASNVLTRTFPKGLDVEVLSAAALARAGARADSEAEREHVTPYLYNHPDLFRLGDYRHTEDHSAHRWTVDYREDLELVRRIYGELYATNPTFDWLDVLRLVEANPELKGLNAHLS